MKNPLFFIAIAVAACSGPANRIDMREGALPAPATNNAVAFGRDARGEGTIYSFLGLGAGKTWRDVAKSAFACAEATLLCRPIGDVPVSEGRLASVAASVGGAVYIFGGYTVAEDGGEKSTPEVFRFDPVTEQYARVADMPTPVDDSTAVVLFDRYVYLVSGWHDDGNVALTQVYDAREDRWFQATDFPGAPVFGQAGGGDGRTMLVMGGVKAIAGGDGKRKFVASDEAWIGRVTQSAPEKIEWSRAPAPPFGPYYRMAASSGAGRIYFAGGGDNPYNYSGVGYDGVDAKPSGKLIAFDAEKAKWSVIGDIPPSMDHRGLVVGDDGLYLVGGLDAALNVRTSLTRIKPE
ncbi:MAG: kelch repeat-containing protein [Parvularculaceae bacterium]